MKWFGPAPFGPVCFTNERGATPSGVCVWCGEPFAAHDDGLTIPMLTRDRADDTDVSYHRECFLRQVVGSVGHQTENCSCHGGADEDPPELSRREAARLAADLFHATHGGTHDADQ